MEKKEFSNTILILFAHPALQKSRVNRLLIRYVRDLEGVTVRDLYEEYPDFHIHVAREQAFLEKNNVIVFHHPIFWFSMPAILKEWMDLVLQHGWAYGKKGTALQGKKLMSVVSTGGRESLYRREGFNRQPLIEYLSPVRQTARVCGMEYLAPFVVHGTHTITPEEIAAHGEAYRKIIEAFRDGRINLEAARTAQRINLDMENIILK